MLFTDLTWWHYVVITLLLTHVSVMAVTIYLHRTVTHGAMELHPALAHTFRFILWFTTGMITKEWVAIHRKHHAEVETENDPHSPVIKGLWKVLLFGVLLYVKESRDRETLATFGHGTPDDWIERNLYSKHQKLGVLLCLLTNLCLFGPLAGACIWSIQMAWIPFWAAGVINGLGHSVGYRNYNTPDQSTNIFRSGLLRFVFSFILGGEENHNNHHGKQWSAKFAHHKGEYDIGWCYIRLFKRCGLAKSVKAHESL